MLQKAMMLVPWKIVTGLLMYDPFHIMDVH